MTNKRIMEYALGATFLACILKLGHAWMTMSTYSWTLDRHSHSVTGVIIAASIAAMIAIGFVEDHFGGQ